MGHIGYLTKPLSLCFLAAVMFGCARKSTNLGLYLVGLALLIPSLSGASGVEFGPISPQGGVWPLTSLEIPWDDQALSPLLDLARNVSVLGLGEQVHNTHETHVARALFIKTLVQRGGYRAIGFEAPWLTTRHTNEYLNNCHGDPRVALQGLVYPAWYDVATLELLQWLCRFNTKHPNDTVTVFGFDIQAPKHTDQNLIVDFFNANEPRVAPRIQNALKNCVGWNPAELKGLTQEKVSLCHEGLLLAKKQLARKRRHYIVSTSAEIVLSIELALLSVDAFQIEALYYNTPNGPEGVQARDAGMSEVFRKLRSFYFPKSKIILYSHNWHLAINTLEPGYPADPDGQAESLGTLLHDRIGEEYAAVGLTGFNIRVNPVIEGQVDMPVPVSSNSADLRLHQAGIHYAWLDPFGAFLSPGVPRETNDLPRPGSRIPGDHYRLMFYIDDSGPLICPDGINCAIQW